MKIKIVYDNRIGKQGFETGWGFSALIENDDKTVLFDTGDSGKKLINNLNKLKVDINKIDALTFSHNHWDHTGGMEDFLTINKNAIVFLPHSFPDETKKLIKSLNHNFKIVGLKKEEILKNIFTTPAFKSFSKPEEQGLVLNTEKGLVLITGCAHPGILFMVREVKKLFSENVKFVIGGFHLKDTPMSEVKEILNELIKEEIEYFGPAHCTGDTAINLFKETTGNKFVKIGSGVEIEF